MPENEKLAFEDEITSDSDLAKKVYEIRLLLLGIMEKNLQDKLPAFHAGVEKRKPHLTQNGGQQRRQSLSWPHLPGYI